MAMEKRAMLTVSFNFRLYLSVIGLRKPLGLGLSPGARFPKVLVTKLYFKIKTLRVEKQIVEPNESTLFNFFFNLSFYGIIFKTFETPS